jgi:hypothetical protein
MNYCQALLYCALIAVAVLHGVVALLRQIRKRDECTCLSEQKPHQMPILGYFASCRMVPFVVGKVAGA